MHTNYSLSYSSFHFLQRKVYDLGHHHKSVHVRRIIKGYQKFQESSDTKRTDLAAETIVRKLNTYRKLICQYRFILTSSRKQLPTLEVTCVTSSNTSCTTVPTIRRYINFIKQMGKIFKACTKDILLVKKVK